MAQAADFFVSYTSADRAWAEWIAWQLEAEGYKVVVQAWDFTGGRDWVHEMQQASSTAERVVAVLSAAYLQSAHGEAEWRVFYAKDPSGERGLLLPVRVDKVDPPGLLKTRVYVDLVDKDAASGRTALLAASRDVRGKPTEEPEFPGDRRPAGSATQAPRFPGELPPVWNVPYHPNPYFTGRDLLLAEVHARLTTPDVQTRRVALTGLGGMGKTQLAVEHVYRQRADYDLVWWVRSEQPTSLLSDYAALARQLPLAADLRLAEDASQEVVAAAVRGWLERHRRWLLVLDNAAEPAAVAGLLPRSGAGHVLLTSQAEVGWEPLAAALPVEVLAPTDAASFLLVRTRQQSSAAAAATTLAGSLGGLPLALEQAAAYVVTAGTVSLADYARLFGTRALELLQRGQPLGYQHTVATTWSLALQQLQHTAPAAVGLLTLAAFLASDDIPNHCWWPTAMSCQSHWRRRPLIRLHWATQRPPCAASRWCESSPMDCSRTGCCRPWFAPAWTTMPSASGPRPPFVCSVPASQGTQRGRQLAGMPSVAAPCS
jgi:TIR domain/NB-ARC domain